MNRFAGEDAGSLHEARRRGELVMFYQPKVDMASGMAIGVEALVRWHHPILGLLCPAMFEVAIKSRNPVTFGLIHWAIHTAVKQIADWKKIGLSIPVSVNVMASELINDNFCEWLDDVFKQHPEVNRTMLELEIVESSNLSNLEQVISVITRCRAAGVKFALDDFGTGYSSLSYVRNVPADYVKIDRMFVKDLTTNHQDRGLVQLVISLAHLFDRKVIAEGVESIEQGSELIKLGCKYAQGYAIARPMAAADLPSWVHQYKGYPEWSEGCLAHEANYTPVADKRPSLC